MGFLDSLRKALTGGAPKNTASGGGKSAFGDDKRSYWIYAKCNRCGEPLKARIDIMNEPSLEDDGRWVVRKGLTGSGRNYCFQQVEVTAYFDAKKQRLLESSAAGGKVLNEDEYGDAVAAWERQQAEEAAARAAEEAAGKTDN